MPLSPEPGPPLLDKLPAALPVERILQASSDEAIIVETYRPLDQGLDWELGQLFYRQRGNSAFLNGEVPYLVNNDGILAARAAELFFLSLEERDDLPGVLRVLEFGGGSCIFARGFLLAFARISQETNRDYHQRLTYILADHSKPMLEDAQRSGVIPSHARVAFAIADAVDQQFEWIGDAVTEELRFDAVFLNYLLDCLPATVLRKDGEVLEQLHVQTEVNPKNPLLRDIPGGRERVLAYASGATRERRELIDLYPLFRLRCRYEPAPEQELPFFQTIAPLLENAKPTLHSYAAVACLEGCLGKLRKGGFILFSDYAAGGSGKAELAENPARLLHQHFGSSTAIGLNLEQLKGYVRGNRGAVWAEPSADDESLIVRLAGAATGDRTVALFRELFDRCELDRLRAARQQARDYRGAGAHQLAFDCYQQAIRMQPENWHLISEAALFCETALRRHQMAVDLARAALELNPIDPDLWNTLGDGLFSLGRTEDAEQAFRWALHLSSASTRARYNLVYSLTRSGDLKGALAMIAESLAVDGAGEYADRLVRRQGEILAAMKQRRRRVTEAMADRYLWESR